MRRPALRFSILATMAAGGFLLLAAAAVGWVVWSSRVPADSGESGVLVLPFIWPWYHVVPAEWLGFGSALAMIGLNGVILYLLFGGLRFSRRG